MDIDTLEEGRVALHLLERQLKEQKALSPIVTSTLTTSTNHAIIIGGGMGSGLTEAGGDNNSVSSERRSVNSERRLLDQVPRDARLHYRKGSPLGLTVEELDDRGLLDGGGSVPSYYVSMRQRGRRPLEMKKRSSRLQDRGKEVRRDIFTSTHLLTKLY